MAAHPNKHIREAIKHAEQNDWTFTKASGRAQFSESSGADEVIVQAVGFASTQLLVILKISHGEFVAQSNVVLTERAIP